MENTEKKWVTGMVLCIITVILLGVTLFMPWWSMKMESKTTELSMSTKSDYGLQEAHSESEMPSIGSFEQTVKYSDKKDDVALDDQIKVYDTTFYIMIAALVSAIVSLVCLTLVRIKKMPAKLGVIFLTITMILTVFAPIYFAATLPNAISKDYDDMVAATEEWGFGSGMFEWKPGCTENFAGVEEREPLKLTWGPSYGWFLTVAAFVLIAVCMMLTSLPSKKPKSVPMKIKIKEQKELPVSSRILESYPEPLPPPKNSMKTRIEAIGIVVIVVVGIVSCVYLSWPVRITEGGAGGMVKIVNVTYEPQNPLSGEKITFTITVENCSWCPPHIHYNSYFAGGASGGGSIPTQVDDNEYSYEIGPFPNGTEVWCMIAATGSDGSFVISDEYIIQIGVVERSNTTSLTIFDVSHDASGTVEADVASNVTVSSVEMKYMYFYSYGSGGGGGSMHLKSGNTYEGWIHLSGFDGELPKGTKVFYKIMAQDESNNTAVSPTFSFTVS